MEGSNAYHGRGSLDQTESRFNSIFVDRTLPIATQRRTTFHTDHATGILSKNTSEDLSFTYSLNPYQGCEHGCSYCYARTSHEYHGLGAGIDFESKIFVKEKAPDLLEKQFQKRWKPAVIALSGNTDCYQPAERTYKLTRRVLAICQQYGNPVQIITKNDLVLRDLDLLQKLADESLVHVMISITSLDEGIRARLEPRTSIYYKRLKAIETLQKARIPTSLLIAPVIPGLTDQEIPELLRVAASAGAETAHYSLIRLNGAVERVFASWLDDHFPDRKAKILHQIAETHEGHVGDFMPDRRMSGKGELAQTIKQLFKVYNRKYFHGRQLKPLSLTRFRKNGSMLLF